MKKLLYFIPAILLAALDVTILVLGIDSPPLRHLLWLSFFLIAGALLLHGHFSGALFGLIPAFEFIHMSTVYTGQVIQAELPIGLTLAIHYLICALLAHRKGKI